MNHRAIAFFLPQFHPIPENDLWWGKGFTEWTNVVKGKPLFKGHYQPHLPADLGFYDLRLAETREVQAALAREHGIHGFCYYHYWFKGRRLLERPVDEILASGKPEFPFCLCWANDHWTRRWDGQNGTILIEQTYSKEDDVNHFRHLLTFFKDPRYIKIDGKPLFVVYRANSIPDPLATTSTWRREAELAGLPGLHLLRVQCPPEETGDPRPLGFDAALEFHPNWELLPQCRLYRQKWWHRKKLKTAEPAFMRHGVYDYDSLVDAALAKPAPPYPFIRSLLTGFDNSARRGQGAIILKNASPSSYKRWLSSLVEDANSAKMNNSPSEQLIFVTAWNEWAEGNHLEPCQKWGRAYLEATRDALNGRP